MAHELTQRADGTVEMAYLDGVYCWHGLGNELKPGATIEEWIEAAGLDWFAQRAKVRYAVAKGQGESEYLEFGQTEIDDDGKKSWVGEVVLFRSDTHAPLGIVSSKYRPVQPRETLEFWRDLVGSGGMTLQTAGSLFGGRKFWALASVGEAAIIDPRNIVRRNLFLGTSLDGTMATTAFYCDETVVCHNTMRSAFEEGTPKIKVSHRTTFDPLRVKKDLGVEAAQSNFESTLAAMRALAEKRVKPTDAMLMVCELLKPGFADLDAKEQKRIENGKPLAEIGSRYFDRKMIGAEFDGYDGTAWGLLNSVTEYVDHAARAKSPDTRMDSAFFGTGADLKERARAMLVEYQPSLDDVVAATMVAPPPSLLDAVLDNTTPI